MFFYSISPLHTRSTLFPYTTLFRSPFAYQWSLDGTPAGTNATLTVLTGGLTLGNHIVQVVAGGQCAGSPGTVTNTATLTVTARSEEHTSELQSHHDLVCRLLLEKKN